MNVDYKTLPTRVKAKSRPIVLNTFVGRIALIPFRLRMALGYFAPNLKRAFGWAFSSRELSNFSYDLTPENCEYLAHTISVVTGVPYAAAMGYIRELQENARVRQYLKERILQSSARYSVAPQLAFARRLGWYAFARILKPRVVVETGVDKGLGAIALCEALLRNEAEGSPGQYFGADINPRAGALLSEPYSRIGKILYGDSIQSLESIPEIDMFVNDSDHSAAHERREYDVIAQKLGANGGLILGDNAHCTDVLAKFSEERGRQFVFFHEQPKDHWYPGAGIGISFLRK
jgi:hypothetical protein